MIFKFFLIVIFLSGNKVPLIFCALESESLSLVFQVSVCVWTQTYRSWILWTSAGQFFCLDTVWLELSSGTQKHVSYSFPSTTLQEIQVLIQFFSIWLDSWWRRERESERKEEKKSRERKTKREIKMKSVLELTKDPGIAKDVSRDQQKKCPRICRINGWKIAGAPPSPIEINGIQKLIKAPLFFDWLEYLCCKWSNYCFKIAILIIKSCISLVELVKRITKL